jgi:hypothetical protein
MTRDPKERGKVEKIEDSVQVRMRGRKIPMQFPFLSMDQKTTISCNSRKHYQRRH